MKHYTANKISQIGYFDISEKYTTISTRNVIADFSKFSIRKCKCAENGERKEISQTRSPTAVKITYLYQK